MSHHCQCEEVQNIESAALNVYCMFNMPRYKILKFEILECFNCRVSTQIGIKPTMRKASMNLDSSVIVLYMKYKCRNNMAVRGKQKLDMNLTLQMTGFRKQQYAYNFRLTSLIWQLFFLKQCTECCVKENDHQLSQYLVFFQHL